MATRTRLTQADLETIDATLGDHGYVGYIGSSRRSARKDKMVLAAANRRGWSIERLANWMCSKYGRWALDASPRPTDDFDAEMAKAEGWLQTDEGRALKVTR